MLKVLLVSPLKLVPSVAVAPNDAFKQHASISMLPLTPVVEDTPVPLARETSTPILNPQVLAVHVVVRVELDVAVKRLQTYPPSHRRPDASKQASNVVHA